MISTLFAEGLLQGVFRYRNSAWIWQMEEAFRVGYTQPVEDRRHYALRPGYHDEEAGITINEQGFRDPLDLNRKGPVLVCLGDSVPFGYGVKDEESYPAVMNALLAETTHMDSAVVNAAIPSYNTRQSYDRMQLDVLKQFDKDRIALFTLQAANDMSLLTHYREQWTPDLTWANLRLSDSWSGPTKLAIIHYYRRAIKRMSVEESHRPYSSIEMIAHLRRTLQQLKTFSETHEIPLILMPIDPFYYQTKGIEMNPELRFWNRYQDLIDAWGPVLVEFNRELVSVSEQSDYVHFFDTRSVLDHTDRNQMFIDVIHYSAAGNRTVAEALLSFIEREGLLEGDKN